MNCFLFVRYLLLFQICICFVTNSILAQENIPNYLDTYSQSVKDVEISKSIMYVNNGKTIETIPEKYSSHSYNERFLLIESVYFNSDKDLFRSYKVDYFNNDKKKSENYTSICKDVIDLLVNVLIPNSTVPDATVFYKKMRGDYYRYLCEFTYNER